MEKSEEIAEIHAFVLQPDPKINHPLKYHFVNEITCYKKLQPFARIERKGRN